jgi:hypothetical protein
MHCISPSPKQFLSIRVYNLNYVQLLVYHSSYSMFFLGSRDVHKIMFQSAKFYQKQDSLHVYMDVSYFLQVYP